MQADDSICPTALQSERSGFTKFRTDSDPQFMRQSFCLPGKEQKLHPILHRLFASAANWGSLAGFG